MSFLEILGLHYLLTDKPLFSDSDLKSIPGVILAIIGFVTWFILGTIAGRYMDLSMAVWNLVPAIILLVTLVARTILSIIKKDEKKKIIFNIINLIITVTFAIIFQLYHPYISLLAKHEYRPIWSFIAYSLWPNFIMLIIYNMLFDKEHGFIGKIAMIPKGFALFILVFLYITFVGQAFSTILYFTGAKDFYNNFAYFHDIQYRNTRKEYKDKSIEEFLNDRYKLVVDKYDEICKSQFSNLSGKEYENKCNELQDKSDGYINTLNSATKKEYGYAIDRFYHIGDTRTDVIRVADYEWNKGSYYILDRNNYTVKETTKKYYEEIRKQNNK